MLNPVSERSSNKLNNKLNKSNLHSLNYSRTTFTVTQTHTSNTEKPSKSKLEKDGNQIQSFPEEISDNLFASLLTTQDPIENKNKLLLTQSTEPNTIIFNHDHPTLTPTFHLNANKLGDSSETKLTFKKSLEKFEKISEKPDEEDDLPKSLKVESDFVEDENEFFIESENELGNSFSDIGRVMENVKSEKLIFVEKH